MDTSKDYYETVMRDFKTYGRGRSLEQFCRAKEVWSIGLRQYGLRSMGEHLEGDEKCL